MPNAARKLVDAPAATDPMQLVRARADALYRAAVECCRQHDRAARLSSGPDDPDREHEQLDELCRMCDRSLAELADAYTQAAGGVHPERDEAWWHRANSLWHASREYGRHRDDCDSLGKRSSGKHSADQLAAMQMEYELEASALLALRHAADAYFKTRPELK